MPSCDRDRLEELAAGFALGNLDAAELQEFQAALETNPSDDLADLLQVKALLQAECEVPDVAPPAHLRLQVLNAARAERETPASKATTPRWQLAVGGCLALGAIALAANNFSLRQQLARIEDRQLQPVAAVTPTLPLALVQTTQQVLDDHVAALQRDRGPAEFVSDRLETVLDHFQVSKPTSPVSNSLADASAKLLGGSWCKFQKSQGLRLSYELVGDTPVSVYRLNPATSAATIAEIAPQPVSVTAADGTNLILWRDGDAAYAIVGKLPLPTLKTLAAI